MRLQRTENFAAPGGLIQTGVAMLHDNKYQ